MLGVKSYEFRMTEKVSKNHVPTCPVFAGAVTIAQIIVVHLFSMIKCMSALLKNLQQLTEQPLRSYYLITLSNSLAYSQVLSGKH